MQRGSDKHGPRLDDQLSDEVEGLLRDGKPTPAYEELEPEAPTEDEAAPVTDVRARSDEDPR